MTQDSSPAARTATSFLKYVTDQQVFDLMFKKSAGSWFPHPSASSLAPSKHVALSFYKGDLQKVQFIVSHPATDPDVLVKFAGDSRVSVRQLLLTHPALPYPTLVKLADWAIQREDTGAVACAMMRLEASDFVELASKYIATKKRQYLAVWPNEAAPNEAVARRLLADSDVCRKALALSITHLNAAIASLVYQEGHPDITLEEVVRVNLDVAQHILYNPLHEGGLLSKDLAAALVAAGTNYRRGAFPSVVFALREAGATEKLLESHVPQLHRMALLNGVDETALCNSLGDASVQILDALLDAMSPLGPEDQKVHVSATVEKAIIDRFLSLGGETKARDPRHGIYAKAPVAVADIVFSCRHRISDEVLLQLLRSGSASSTDRWLALPAGHVNGVRPGLLSKLKAKPGSAFGEYVRAVGSPSGWEFKENPRKGFVDRRRTIAACGDPSTFAEIVAILDDEIGKELVTGFYSEAVWPALYQAFGSDIEAWDSFLGLVDGWTGTFSELVRSVCLLTGTDPGAVAVPTADPQDEPAVCEAVALF